MSGLLGECSVFDPFDPPSYVNFAALYTASPDHVTRLPKGFLPAFWKSGDVDLKAKLCADDIGAPHLELLVEESAPPVGGHQDAVDVAV